MKDGAIDLNAGKERLGALKGIEVFLSPNLWSGCLRDYDGEGDALCAHVLFEYQGRHITHEIYQEVFAAMEHALKEQGLIVYPSERQPGELAVQIIGPQQGRCDTTHSMDDAGEGDDYRGRIKDAFSNAETALLSRAAAVDKSKSGAERNVARR